jgi:hypothetical protein
MAESIACLQSSSEWPEKDDNKDYIDITVIYEGDGQMADSFAYPSDYPLDSR